MQVYIYPFPAQEDAGKALDWISRQISSTALAKDLQSKIQEQCDVQTCSQTRKDPQEVC